ncbi:MAG: GNAT family N-acetyltransferase [Bacteroidetes bacterium]|nr:GNAT family N-acetyltransferase [Bacteroidota bacterium]
MTSLQTDISNITIRQARAEDGPCLLSLIDALADYEKLARPDEAARRRLLQDGFGTAPRYEAWLAFVGDNIAGYAIIFETYSSFLALPTLYLEDIFILPAQRKRKAGFALFLHCVRLARDRGCGRMDWTVLHWNELAKEFYRRLGAAHLDEWQLYRLTRTQFDALPLHQSEEGHY